MWIRNKVTNSIQEIHNADVIKICQKDTEKFEVSETMPVEGENTADAAAQADKKAKDAEEAEKAKAAAEAAKKAEEEKAAADAAAQATDVNPLEGKTFEEVDYKDLKKIAKEKGIQGYQNMDKKTLFAVIQAH